MLRSGYIGKFILTAVITLISGLSGVLSFADSQQYKWASDNERLAFLKEFCRAKNKNYSEFEVRLPFVTRNSKIVIFADRIGGSRKAYRNTVATDDNIGKPVAKLYSAELKKNEYNIIKYVRNSDPGNTLTIKASDQKLKFSIPVPRRETDLKFASLNDINYIVIDGKKFALKLDVYLHNNLKPGNWVWNKEQNKLEYEKSEEEKLFNIKPDLPSGFVDFLRTIEQWNANVDWIKKYKDQIAANEKELNEMDINIRELRKKLGYLQGRSSKYRRTGSYRRKGFDDDRDSSYTTSRSSRSSRYSQDRASRQTLTDRVQSASERRNRYRPEKLQKEYSEKSDLVDKQNILLTEFQKKMKEEQKSICGKSEKYLNPIGKNILMNFLFGFKEIAIPKIGPYFKPQ